MFVRRLSLRFDQFLDVWSGLSGDPEGGAASIPVAEGLLRIRRPAGERLSLLQGDCSLSVCRLRQAESLSLILTSAVSIKL